MSDTKLGSVPNRVGERDAVHVAVVAMEASEQLRPGQYVNFMGDSQYPTAIPCTSKDAVGIVDPFSTQMMEAGHAVWVCLFPGSVTGMKHYWLHPKFIGNNDVPVIVNVVAEICGKTVTALLEDMKYHADCNYDDWQMDNSERYKGVIEAQWEEVWKYVGSIHELKPSKYGRSSPYTCSC